jgi:hypothetical protein
MFSVKKKNFDAPKKLFTKQYFVFLHGLHEFFSWKFVCEHKMSGCTQVFCLDFFQHLKIVFMHFRNRFICTYETKHHLLSKVSFPFASVVFYFSVGCSLANSRFLLVRSLTVWLHVRQISQRGAKWDRMREGDKWDVRDAFFPFYFWIRIFKQNILINICPHYKPILFFELLRQDHQINLMLTGFKFFLYV